MIMTHGQAVRGHHSRTYRIWRSVKQRCLDKTSTSYKDYGAKGIALCVRWLVFENFLADMGECPDGLTLDRVKNELGYQPGNCRWATMKDQQRNRTNNRLIEFEGRTQCLFAWAEELGMKPQALHQRLRRWKDIKKAFKTPIRV